MWYFFDFYNQNVTVINDIWLFNSCLLGGFENPVIVKYKKKQVCDTFRVI